MASDIEEEAFEMKRPFEMKRKNPIRKDRDGDRMSDIEARKKGRKNHSSPESRNESNRVMTAADCKKMSNSVNNEERNISLGVNENPDKTFVNEMKRNMLLGVNENRNKTFVNEIEVMTAQVTSGIAKYKMTALVIVVPL